MTKFEEIGCEMQSRSATIREADSRYERTCTICCMRNMHIECDRCAIAAVHEKVTRELSRYIVGFAD